MKRWEKPPSISLLIIHSLSTFWMEMEMFWTKKTKDLGYIFCVPSWPCSINRDVIKYNCGRSSRVVFYWSRDAWIRTGEQDWKPTSSLYLYISGLPSCCTGKLDHWITHLTNENLPDRLYFLDCLYMLDENLNTVRLDERKEIKDRFLNRFASRLELHFHGILREWLKRSRFAKSPPSASLSPPHII